MKLYYSCSLYKHLTVLCGSVAETIKTLNSFPKIWRVYLAFCHWACVFSVEDKISPKMKVAKNYYLSPGEEGIFPPCLRKFSNKPYSPLTRKKDKTIKCFLTTWLQRDYNVNIINIQRNISATWLHIEISVIYILFLLIYVRHYTCIGSIYLKRKWQLWFYYKINQWQSKFVLPLWRTWRRTLSFFSFCYVTDFLFRNWLQQRSETKVQTDSLLSIAD